jgi:peptidoglycan/LPS O-acetylase OafA/YrhL
MKYRAEIDGLRCVAVVPVVLFHAGLSMFAGGYVGVDIFFVISGYLITTILYREALQGRLSIRRFYDRRVRRIIPALLLVTAFSTIVSLLIMLPTQLEDYGKSVVAVNLFVSNILFWRESGYFAGAAELKPMLHTWSLAVEEQFYIVFPLVIALLVPRLRILALVGLIAFVTLASFALSDFAATWKPVANFYLAPTRAWELLVGALCAFYLHHKGQQSNEWLALAGVIAIALSIVMLDDLTPFPSRFALPAVLGTALIIVYASKETWTARALSLKPLVYIGLISYSAYLWHQPLLAFARLQMEHPPTLLLVVLGIASFPMAFLSWRYVEQPFRTKSAGTNAPLVSSAMLWVWLGLPFLAVTLFAVYLVVTDGLRDRYVASLTPQEQQFFAAYEDAKADIWTDESVQMFDDGECRFHATSLSDEARARLKRCSAAYGPGILIVGDSHAMDLYNGIAMNTAKPFVFGLSRPGCRLHEGEESCIYADLAALVRDESENIDAVFYQQAGFYLMMDERGNTGRRSFFEKANVPEYRINTDYLNQIGTYLDKLGQSAEVIWVGSRVEPHLTPEKMIRRGCDYKASLTASHMGNFERLDEAVRAQIDTSRPAYGYLSEFEAVALDPSVDLYDCEAIYWSDGDHWSIAGERRFGRRVVEFAQQHGLNL